MKIRFSKDSIRQLDNIAENIIENNGKLAARRFNKELKRKLRLAIRHPEMYPASYDDKAIRRIILTTRPHVCFYKIREEELLILSVVLNHPRADEP